MEFVEGEGLCLEGEGESCGLAQRVSVSVAAVTLHINRPEEASLPVGWRSDVLFFCVQIKILTKYIHKLFRRIKEDFMHTT